MRTNVDTFRKWLEVLRFLEEERTMTQIAEAVKVAYKTVLKLVDDLEELGLIEKQLDASTPPRYLIRRTKRGDCLVRCFEEY